MQKQSAAAREGLRRMSAPAPDGPAPRLLLIEDDDAVRRALQLLLTGQGYEVHAFSRAAPALVDPVAIASSHLIIDYALPELDGVQALRSFRSHGWKGCAVLITASHSPQLQSAALDAGFSGILSKPFHDVELLEALAQNVPTRD